MGAISAQVLVVGCEPNDFGEELEGRMGLSPPVQAVVEDAVHMLEELVERILSEHGTSTGELEMTEVRL
jgi:hydrogenase maturation protease